MNNKKPKNLFNPRELDDGKTTTSDSFYQIPDEKIHETNHPNENKKTGNIFNALQKTENNAEELKIDDLIKPKEKSKPHENKVVNIFDNLENNQQTIPKPKNIFNNQNNNTQNKPKNIFNNQNNKLKNLENKTMDREEFYKKQNNKPLFKPNGGSKFNENKNLRNTNVFNNLENKKENSPEETLFYPKNNDLKHLENLQNKDELYKPKNEEKLFDKDDEDLKILDKLNRKISVFLKPKSIDITDDEKKKKIGVTLTTLIIIVLIVSCYYFLIYEPSQQSLEEARNEKLNELHSLYKGPLASSAEAFTLEKQINDAKSAYEVNAINIVGPATKDWKSFQQKSVNENHDDFNRTMAVYETEDNKSVIMTVDEALKLINDNGVDVLSNIKFEKPNTISVPILISRLQAGAGLISVGSVVDIYMQKSINNTETVENESAPSLSGCSVVSIMRCEASGEIESEYGTAQTVIHGNSTNPNENTKTFTANVIEMIKGSLAGGYNEQQTIKMLEDYGVKLSNCEREINLAELDTQYLILLEVPHDKVNYIINNMDSIILTIPTKDAPDWMVNEILSSYKK